MLPLSLEYLITLIDMVFKSVKVCGILVSVKVADSYCLHVIVAGVCMLFIIHSYI